MTKDDTSYREKFIILTAVFVIVFMISCVIGRFSLSLPEFFRILASKFIHVKQTWSVGAGTVFAIRIRRVFMTFVVGAALSLAGASYQGMFRNPMVSPDILGASAGAGFGASLAILMEAGYVTICTSSFAFGMLAVFLAYLFSRISRSNEILGMVLSGIIVSSIFSSGTSLLKLLADTQSQLPEITYWLMGSFTSVDQTDLIVCIPIVLSALVLILLRWRLNLMTIDEESANTMGVNIRALRLCVVICATLLTASSVAVTGMIGWVGLVIPHFCRMIFGYDYKRIVPASILFGGAFLAAVDDLARVVTTGEIPIGILTSFVGAPLLLYLLATGGVKSD